MILWKNVRYNLVVRQIDLFKYYWRGQHKDSHYPLADWSCFCRPYTRPWTKAQEDKRYEALHKAVRNTVFQPPLTWRHNCQNKTYRHFENPKKFYQKLLQLDAKRGGGNTMRHDQWREDMFGGVALAHKNRGEEMLMLSVDTPGIGKTYMGKIPFTPLTVTEAVQLHKSINATADPEQMKADTIFRTGGVIGGNNAERINGIAESFHQLNRGRDGG